MSPVLSICILTYNRSDYLEELLNSIFTLNENLLAKIEVVIINNGSTDTTNKLLEKYSQTQKIKVETFLENQRGSSAYLNLVARSVGTYLIFPGDDDVFKTESLAAAVQLCSTNNESWSLIAYGADVIDELGRPNLLSYQPPVNLAREQLIAKLLVDAVFWLPCTIIRRDLFKGKPDPLTITAFDWWIWLNGALNGEIKFIDQNLISYRQHIGQEQKSFLKINWDIDSFLMLSKELNSKLGQYLSELDNDSQTVFLHQLSFEINKLTFNQFQIIKWTFILTTLAGSIGAPKVLQSVGNLAKIWNDPRFVESWFACKLSTEEILNFFNFWKVQVKIKVGLESLGDSQVLELDHINQSEETVLTLFKENQSNNFSYRLSFYKNGKITKFSGNGNENLRTHLKTIFGLVVLQYRELETLSEITPFERKCLILIRRIKSTRFINLIKTKS